MQRKAYQTIKKADSEGKRTFVVYGMPSVGKTSLVLDCVKSSYEEYLYIDGQFDWEFKQFFSDYASFDIDLNDTETSSLLVDMLSNYFKISPEYLVNIPIILDELGDEMLESGIFDGYNGELKLFIIISDTDKAYALVNSLSKTKASYLNALTRSEVNQYNIELIHIYPLNFGEFLMSQDKEWYDEVIVGHMISKRKLPDMIHEELMDLFSIFRTIGGMPEVVEEYIKNGTLENIRQKQIRTAASVISPIIKHYVSPTKLEAVIEAVEASSAKDTHKFMYSSVRDGATRKQYEPVIEHLCSKEVVFKVTRLNESRDFRLILSDIGLYTGKETGLLESLILKEIRSSGIRTNYWESGKGASVGMVAEGASGPIPIEFKKDRSNLRSVKAFLKETGTNTYLRLSDENIKEEQDFVSIPYYASYSIEKLLDKS